MRKVLLAVGVCLLWLPGAAHGIGEAEHRQTLLPPIPANDSSATWSKDGTRVFFMRRFYGFGSVSVDGSDERWVNRYVTSAAFSPDGDWVAYIGGQGAFGLWTSRASGSGARFIRATSGVPAWSPDSRRIAFEAADGLWVVDRDGGDALRVAASGSDPSWSPDGAWIAFSARPPGGLQGDLDLMVVGSSGGTPRLLVDSAGAQVAPTWSPDGSLVAFVGDATGTPDGLQRPVVVRPDGSGLRVFTDTAAAGGIAWMPDARRLVVAAPTLILLDVASGVAAHVPFGAGRGPSPSPDGSRIAYAAVGDCGRDGIYVVGVDGKQSRRLTNKCTFVGTPGPDVLRGTGWKDRLLGLGGNDQLYAVETGGALGDTLEGGPGNDLLFGDRRAPDVLYGGPGNDRIHGDSGRDKLYGGPGRDLLFGDDGRDVVYARDGVRDVVVCGSASFGRERDSAWVDRHDLVSRDCEVVHRPRR